MPTAPFDALDDDAKNVLKEQAKAVGIATGTTLLSVLVGWLTGDVDGDGIPNALDPDTYRRKKRKNKKGAANAEL